MRRINRRQPDSHFAAGLLVVALLFATAAGAGLLIEPKPGQVLVKGGYHTELELELGTRFTALGLFPLPAAHTRGSWFLAKQLRTNQFRLTRCDVKYVEEPGYPLLFDRGGLIVAEQDSSLGTPLFLFKDVPLPESASLEAIFAGVEGLYEFQAEREQRAWRTLSYDTPQGNVVLATEPLSEQTTRRSRIAIVAHVGDRQQSLATYVERPETGPFLNWLGDLDGDGIPDLILDLGGYNASHYYLFLSGIAEEGQLYGVIGSPRMLGC